MNQAFIGAGSHHSGRPRKCQGARVCPAPRGCTNGRARFEVVQNWPGRALTLSAAE